MTDVLLVVFQELFAAGAKKAGTDEEKFVQILGRRSIEHLRQGNCRVVCVNTERMVMVKSITEL